MKQMTRIFPALSCLMFSLVFWSCVEKKSGPISADAATGYCPVCGMKVTSGDQFASEIIYKDGTKLMFESAGDMMTFYSAPDRYNDVTAAQKSRTNIEKVLVKDYNSRKVIDAREASLVYKSKIEGPMGPDLLAFNRPEEARDFAAANGGKVVTFGEVTPEMVQNLRKN